MIIIKKEIEEIIRNSILELQGKKKFPLFAVPEIKLDYSKNEKFGDYTTNAALVLAGILKKNPMEIAEQMVILLNGCIVQEPLPLTPLPEGEGETGMPSPLTSPKGRGGKSGNFHPERDARVFEKIEVMKPGYINFYLSKEFLRNKIIEINEEKEKFGGSEIGKGKKVLIEFISSNPTGPIHLGNGRGGPLGDTLGNILEKSGYEVKREFYVNDFGGQVEILGHSVLKDGQAQYRGDYIDELARDMDKNIKDPKEAGVWTAGIILEKLIKPTCGKLGIRFDNWFFESELHEKKETDQAIEMIKEKKLSFEKDKALWYKSTEFGDDKDRVLIKSDGSKTYLAADFAYHKNKIERGFDKLINIQGADHHKEAAVVKSFVENVLKNKTEIDYILTQFVRIVKDGKEMKMSKREGVYFALDDLIEEAGRDAVRFIFLSYAPSSHVNFDINLARERSEKNPVYYAQYAHARISSILRKSQIPNPKSETNQKSKIQNPKLSLLTHEKELSLIRELNKFPELIEEITKSYEVHKLPHYAIKLADKFHSFYSACRVLDDSDADITRARLNLINAVRIVLAETLRIMGIKSPERM